MVSNASKGNAAALAGLTVLEYAGFVAGPSCGKLLADMGAEVTKVEPPTGDQARHLGPFPAGAVGPETSALFLYLNTNKKSVTIDGSSPTGAELLRSLASAADVLIEDKPPGVMEASGLGYEALRKANPGLVYLSITPFGQTGPYSRFKAYDLNVFFSGGEGYTLPGSMSHALFPERGPVRAGGYLAQYDSGLVAGIAIVAALLDRGVSRQGSHLDLSQQETAMAMARETLQRYAGYGEVVDRSRAYFYGGIFPCQDGYVILFPREDRHWQALCEAMGRPGLASESRFADFASRKANRLELNEILRTWTRDLPMERIYHEAAGRGCPAAPYHTAADLATSEQLEARRFFTELDHPVAGRLQYPTAAYGMSATKPVYRSAAPLLGEHNEELFCGRLGLSPRELADLGRSGVL